MANEIAENERRRMLSKVEFIPLYGEAESYRAYLNVGSVPLSAYIQAIEEKNYTILQRNWGIRCRHYLISVALLQKTDFITLVKAECRNIENILYDGPITSSVLVPIQFIEEKILGKDSEYLDAIKLVSQNICLYSRNDQLFDRFSLICQMSVDYIKRELQWLKSQSKETFHAEMNHDNKIISSIRELTDRIATARAKGSNIPDTAISDMLENWATVAFKSTIQMYRPEQKLMMDYWLNEMKLVNKKIGRENRTKYWLDMYFSLPILYRGKIWHRYYDILVNEHKRLQ